MEWKYWIAAVALALAFEVMLPAIAPDKWREMIHKLLQLSDISIQKIALTVLCISVSCLMLLML